MKSRLASAPFGSALLGILFFGFGTAFPAARADSFKATLYEIGSNRQTPLYRFDHAEVPDGASYKSIHNVYRDPSGAEAVIEDITFDSGQLQHFTLEQKQEGKREELEVEGNKVIFSITEGSKVEKSDEKLASNLVVGATLIPYMKAHWAELLKGEKVSIRYAALDRKETVGFTLKKVDSKPDPDQPKTDAQTVIEMKPTSFFIAAIVKSLYFTFSTNPVKALSILGRATPKLKSGSSWKDLDADMVFEYPPAGP